MSTENRVFCKDCVFYEHRDYSTQPHKCVQPRPVPHPVTGETIYNVLVATEKNRGLDCADFTPKKGGATEGPVIIKQKSLLQRLKSCFG